MTEEMDGSAIVDAAHAARHGDYATARTILDDLGGSESPDPTVLDLLARVYAQQGNLADAEICWRRSAQFGGDRAAADAGRHRIEELRKGVRPQRNISRALVIGAFAGVVVVGAGVLGAVLTRPSAPQPAADPAAQRTIISLSQQVDQLRNQPDAVSAQRSRMLDQLTTALAGPLMTISRAGDQIHIRFKVPIFGEATKTSQGGGAALTDLGARLRPFGKAVTVTITGHTEALRVAADSGFASNDALGLARALTAATQLAASSGQPLSAFDLATAGTTNPPYSNATPQGSALNHTITVDVRPN